MDGTERRTRGVTIGRWGALARSGVCAAGGVTALAVSRAALSQVYFPFQAALHERYLPVALLALAVFYLLVGLDRIDRRLGFGVGALDGLLGLLGVAFRLRLSGAAEPTALASIAVTGAITAAMAWGLLATEKKARGRAVRIAAVALPLYLLLTHGLYPLSYAVGWWRRPAVSLADLSPAPPFERSTRQIDGKRYAVFYGELHGHSHFSIDARLFGARSPREYYRYAREIAGLDFCALTDHDSPNGISDNPELWRYECRLADELNDPGRFVTFKGFEWTSGEGHAELIRRWTGSDRWTFRGDHAPWGHRNVFFPGVDVPPVPFSHNDPECDTPEELWEKMQRWGAISIPHHSLGGPVPPLKWDHHDPAFEPLVEIYSTHGSSESDEARLRIYNAYIAADGSTGYSVQHALGQGHHFGLIGSTDTHTGWGGNRTTRPESSYPIRMIEWLRDQYGGEPAKGGGLAAVYAEELTRASVWEAFRARRTFATTGPRMVVALQANGTFMGSTAKIAPGRRITLRGEATGEAALESLELVRDGEVVHTQPGAGERTGTLVFEDQGPPSGERYYYLRVVQTDGEMAWSSPVWVKAEP